MWNKMYLYKYKRTNSKRLCWSSMFFLFFHSCLSFHYFTICHFRPTNTKMSCVPLQTRVSNTSWSCINFSPCLSLYYFQLCAGIYCADSTCRQESKAQFGSNSSSVSKSLQNWALLRSGLWVQACCKREMLVMWLLLSGQKCKQLGIGPGTHCIKSTHPEHVLCSLWLTSERFYPELSTH